MPGVATPTEAFAALKAGADGLKAFPAEMIGPAVVKAWRAVIPLSVPILPVGGIAPASMAPYVAAGASGFGLGSALYRPRDSAASLREKAEAFARGLADARGLRRRATGPRGKPPNFLRKFFQINVCFLQIFANISLVVLRVFSGLGEEKSFFRL